MKKDALLILSLLVIAVFLLTSLIVLDSIVETMEVRIGLTFIVLAIGLSLIVFDEMPNPKEVRCPHCRTLLHVSITEEETD